MTYYCVTSKFYRDGRIEEALTEHKAKEKPANTSKHTDECTIYVDWFTTREAAQGYIDE